MVKVLLINKQERLCSERFKFRRFNINKNKINKKAAIGAAMTWVVATLIILLAIVLFVYSSYAIAKQRGLLGFDLVDLEKQDTYIESQQTLLALMDTEIGGKSIRQSILDGDIIKEDLEALLQNLPEDDWSLYIDDLKINEPVSKDFFETKTAVVFIGNKKVKLFQSRIG